MTGSLGNRPYRGERLSILTRHGKEKVIAPLLASSLDARLELANGFDTDAFGTFTRDVARNGSQLEAARRKAEKGMELLGLDRGLASEGSFGPDPFGLLPWNLELVVLVDRVRNIEIVGRAEGPADHVHEHVTTRDALEALARRAGFPRNGLVLRPDGPDHPHVRKGLTDWPSLHAAFEETRAESRTSAVFVESDLRAHLNPTRMEMIRKATANLIGRIQSECPRCRAPGFWPVERMEGLPCRDCGSPTREILMERWGCVRASHFETRYPSPGRRGDPHWCVACNP